MRAIPDEYRECNAVSNVQNEFSVWGEEFVNFIAATLTVRGRDQRLHFGRIKVVIC